ncbi:NUDIX hydrolase [Corallincola spongiicola]|uniref:NUDIX domain-containing protein n=1 Tax=Corallincola spongiicola TaxID=2520508 RepID=A0ABY1WM42_9GAMM|nr:NUDIX hydrolase [Corallincola spongiicola]TAA42646.1 NUDIX domain-containing protein [Corallincola spongiicola]
MFATVDVALFRINPEVGSGQLELLLWRRKADSDTFPNCFALPGGYVFENTDEQLQDTVSRLIINKVGVEPAHIEQVCTVGNAKRDPRGWSMTVLHLALVPFSRSALVSDEQCWVPARHYANSTAQEQNKGDKNQQNNDHALPFDHNQLVTLAVERLSSKALYTSQPLYLAEPTCSLPELQRIYEELLQNKLHKKAFRDRLLATNLLVDTGKRIQGRGSPTVLYHIQQTGITTFERVMQGHKKD